MGTSEFLAVVQTFLLAMIVVGMMIKALGGEDPEFEFGPRVFMFFAGIVGWAVITAVTVAAMIGLCIGAVWAWVYVSGLMA